MSHEPIVLAFAATFVVLKILRTKPLSTDFTQEPATNRHLERMDQILCGKLPRMEFTSSTTCASGNDGMPMIEIDLIHVALSRYSS